ncbi:MAG: Flap endonuclease 1 [Candidatus Thorarchaeota archaeon AB_25]|nr:MAG: Flap endonuclease 1 [Candidatus Thorarchaeota archaeon AB_25]
MGVKNWNDSIVPWRWTGLEEISPGTVAIDVPNYLTRRLVVMKTTKAPDGRLPLTHVGTFLSLIRSTLSVHILPVMIFDGPPESRKRKPNPELIQTAHNLYKQFVREGDPYNEEIAEALWKSRAVRMYFAAEHIRALSRIIGVPIITAPSEAEMMAAAMCRDNLVDTVVSNDVDALLFGSPHVSKQLQVSNGRILRAKLEELEIQMELDLERLRDLAVLCGCDFHEGLKGVGPRKGAILLQRHGGLSEVLKAKGIPHAKREEFILAREVFDEPSYLSTDSIELRLNPPIVPKLTRSLQMLMSEAAAETSVEKILKLWKGFGTRQSSLEQWI